MDPHAEIADMKRQIAGLRGDVVAARGEAKAVAIAFSAMLDEVKQRDPQLLDEFKKGLNRYMVSLQTGGNVDLLRALSDLY